MRPSALAYGLFAVLVTASTIERETVYNYGNDTAYIHIYDGEELIIPLQFNEKYETGAEISDTIALPGDSCTLFSASSDLYAICADANNYTEISLYNSSSDSWSELDLADDIPMYEGTAYMNTFDDPDSLYIYGGMDTDDDKISSRLKRIGLDDMSVNNVSVSITPSSFYGSSNLKITYNTELLIGGKTSSGWIGMGQLPMWQYGSWSFKTTTTDDDDTINSRIKPLLLPIFESSMLQTAATSGNFSFFEVENVLMIGGELSSSSGGPDFAQLNVSASNWGWSSLDDTITAANKKNTKQNYELELDTMLGAAVIYDTLVVITDTGNSTSSNKRSTGYYVSLYGTDDMKVLTSVDYSSVGETKTVGGHSSNKAIVIALAVVLPILLIVLLAVLALFLYKRHKKKQEEEANEKEMKDIMEFYKAAPANVNNSSSTFSSSDLSSKPRTSQEENYNEKEVQVNNFDDGDNLSISSWRRKREMYEQQKKMRDGSIRRTLSTMSSNLGKSLRRSFSYQSSTGGSLRFTNIPEDQEIDTPMPVESAPMNKASSNAGLYQIPEDSSVDGWPKRQASKSSLYFHPKDPSSEHVTPVKQQQNRPLGSPIRPPVQIQSPSPVRASQAAEIYTPQKSPPRSPQRSQRSPQRSPQRSQSPMSLHSMPTTLHKSSMRLAQTRSLHYEPENPFISILDDQPDVDDVQILVSSKRRSKLHVTNPDTPVAESEIDTVPETVPETEAHKRIVSDESDKSNEEYQ